MPGHAFFIAGDRVIPIANPCGAGLQYRARGELLGAGETTEVQQHEGAETTIVVTEGAIEVMVDGAIGAIQSGGFATVPPGAMFSYRNAGLGQAQLLLRTAAPQAPIRSGCRIVIQMTAAA